MKIKHTLLAAALGLAFAGQANALVMPNVTPGNGSLFLSVWDSSTAGTWGFAYDTGLTFNQFLANNVTTNVQDGSVTGTRTPEAGLTLNFNTGLASALSSFTGNQADLRWNVVAADAYNGSLATNTNVRNLVTTTQVGTALSPFGASQTVLGTLNNSQLTTVTNNVRDATTRLNVAGCSAATSCLDSGVASEFFWVGGTQFGNTLGNANLSTSTALGGSLWMMFLGQDGTGNVSGSTILRPDAMIFGNSENKAIWTLDSIGTLTYNLAAAGGTPSEVPLPAAVWLFGSGLLGLVGIARRRGQQA